MDSQNNVRENTKTVLNLVDKGEGNAWTQKCQWSNIDVGKKIKIR